LSGAETLKAPRFVKGEGMGEANEALLREIERKAFLTECKLMSQCEDKLVRKMAAHTLWQYLFDAWEERYPAEFNKELKASIRKRDDFRCMLCGQAGGGRELDVHHVDFNRQNCETENLVTLCRSCHMRTNTHIPLRRAMWRQALRDLRIVVRCFEGVTGGNIGDVLSRTT